MTADRITANPLARDFDQTCAFYGLLGFQTLYRDESWLILWRCAMQMEFFPHPDLMPAQSWFSACIHVDHLDGLRAAWMVLDLGDDPMKRPREMPVIGGSGAPRYFALIDCDGSLLRGNDNGSV